MGKTNEVDFRVAVGTPDGPRSSVWRGFSTKNEVYVSHGGMGGIHKFSFHSSGICRLAFTEHEGPGEGEVDRVIHRWRRVKAPPSGGIVYSLIARFPTNYLSTALKVETKKVNWIPSASSGQATALDFVFSRAEKHVLDELAKSAGRTIFSFTRLPNGEAFVASWSHQDWIGGEDFTVPRVFDADIEYVISTDDPNHTGRPARFTMYQEPNDRRPTMIADEYGAYIVSLGTRFPKPMGMLSRNKVLKRNRK